MRLCAASRYSRRPVVATAVWVTACGVAYLACAFARPALADDITQATPVTLLHDAAKPHDRLPRGPIVLAADRFATTMPWRSLGPDHIEGVLNPGDSVAYVASGRITSIALDPRDGQRAYVAAAQGGVWRTEDGGASWTPLSDQLSSLCSGAVALDSDHPDTLFYGTGEQNYCGDCLYGDGLFRSPDRGVTWSKLATTSDVGSYIARVLVRPHEATTLFAASERGVVRSGDAGASWQVILGTGWCNDLALDAHAPDTLFAAINIRGIYKSVDGGDSWILLTGGLPSTHFSRINFALSPSDSRVLYASYVDGASGDLLGLYRTGDGGATWLKLSAAPDYLVSTVGAPAGQGWFDNCLVVDPADANVCYAGGAYPSPHANSLIKTTDGGASWTGVGMSADGAPMHHDHHALAFGTDGTLWDGNDGGVWTTADGGAHWTNRCAGLGIVQFYTLASDPADPSLLVGGTQDQGTVAWSGGVWSQRITTDGGPCLVDPVVPLQFFGTQREMISLRYVTPDSASERTGPWVAANDRAAFANGPLVRDPLAPDTLYLGTYRVWESDDAGFTWTAISSSLTQNNFGVLQSIGLGTGSPRARYAGSSDGNLWISTDDAPLWTLRNAGLPAAPFWAIAVDPNEWHTAYVIANITGGDRIFRTTDAGITWSSVTADLPTGVRPISLAVNFLPAAPSLYIGTDYGVYASPDGGAHWNAANDGLPRLAVYALVLDLPANRLLAGTHGRGVWSSPLPVPASVRRGDSPDSPPSLVWLAAHAAPGGGTRIRFGLGHGAPVSFDLFATTGVHRGSLALGWRPAGTHEVLLNLRHLAPRGLACGVYVLRLNAGSVHATALTSVAR